LAEPTEIVQIVELSAYEQAMQDFTDVQISNITETTIETIIYNNTDFQIMFGQPFTIERYSNGSWERVPIIETYPIRVFTAEGMIANPNGTFTMVDDISYHEMSAGLHRINREIVTLTGNHRHILSAEFEWQ